MAVSVFRGDAMRMDCPANGCLSTVLALSAVALLAGAPSQAQTGAPAYYCKRVGTDDTLRAVPLSLAPEVRRLLGLDMPDEATARTSYFRCMAGSVMVCTAGANLPCGKANISRSLPAVEQYCRANPNADIVPTFVTGHDTIYQWRCEGTAAVAGGEVERIDERGFFTRFWQRVP
jgi:hypothetical protein